MTYHAKVFAGGKIVIPAELRREFGIREGDSLVVERLDNGGITLKTFEQIVREGQLKFRAMVGSDYTVAQFIADRHVDWPDDS